MVTETRIIKKYGNRKLYDTKISKYVTLDKVLSLMCDEEEENPIVVIDDKSKQDITSEVIATAVTRNNVLRHAISNFVIQHENAKDSLDQLVTLIKAATTPGGQND